ANDGYTVGPTPYWGKHPLWEKDPKLIPFREASKFGRWPGYPGPPSRKASEALVKYILVDMYAQAIKGMKAEDAVKWAEGELKKEHIPAGALLAPTLVILTLFIAYPFVLGIWLAVSDKVVGRPGNFVGLQNFWVNIHDTIFLRAFQNTFVYTFIATILKLALG